MKVFVIVYEWPPNCGGLGFRAKNYISECKIDIDASITKIGGIKKNPQKWKASELLLWTLKARRFVKQRIRLTRPDVIHVFGGLPGIFTIPKTDIPVVISLSGSDVPGFSERTSTFYTLFPHYKKMIRNHTLVANSRHFANLAKRSFGLDIEVIPPPLPKIKPIKNHIDHIKKAVWVGRDIPRKRKYLAVLQGVVPVEFHTHTPNVTDILHKYDLFICTSINEGMSMSMVEAMACGLPVVTTPCGGHEELIIPGVTGYVCYPLDLSKTLLKAMKTKWNPAIIRDHVAGVCKNAIRDYEKIYKETNKDRPA